MTSMKIQTIHSKNPETTARSANALRPGVLKKSAPARRIPPLGARSQFLTKDAPTGLLQRLFRLLGLGTPA